MLPRLWSTRNPDGNSRPLSGASRICGDQGVIKPQSKAVQTVWLHHLISPKDWSVRWCPPGHRWPHYSLAGRGYLVFGTPSVWREGNRTVAGRYKGNNSFFPANKRYDHGSLRTWVSITEDNYLVHAFIRFCCCCCCCFLLYLGADYFTCSFTALAIYRLILVSIYLLIYLCVYLLICRVIYLFVHSFIWWAVVIFYLHMFYFVIFLSCCCCFVCLFVLCLFSIVLCGKFGSPYPVSTAATGAALLILTSVWSIFLFLNSALAASVQDF